MATPMAPPSAGAPGAAACHAGRPAPAPQPPRVPAPPSSGAPGAAAAHARRPLAAPQQPRVPAPPSSGAPGPAAAHARRPLAAPQPPCVPAPPSSGAPGPAAAHDGTPPPSPQPPCVPAPTSSGAPGAAAAQPASPQPPHARQFPYAGVQRAPCGGWMAHVLVDPERHGYRAIGPFPDEHAAALAHDRVAIAFLGASAHVNFRPAFHPIEQQFLWMCRTREDEVDVCALVADGGAYEAAYAAFLRSVLNQEQWGEEYMGLILEFFFDRAGEIGPPALAEGGSLLVARFVEMHRNKALDPRWRAWYEHKKADHMERERLQQHQREGSCATALQPQQPGGGGDTTVQV